MLRGICVAAALCVAGPVGAAIVTVTMSGTLETRGPPRAGLEETTENTPLSVGDTITATLSFNDLIYYTEGSKTFYTAWPLDFYGGSITISVGPFTWTHIHEIMSGEGGPQSDTTFGEYGDHIDMPRPLIVFDNGVFAGFADANFDGDAANVPDFLPTGFDFALREAGYIPYIGPSFTGSFDPASVQITGLASPAPEPSAWAMMLLGFGGVGAAARRSRRALRTA